jgi:predicted permease
LGFGDITPSSPLGMLLVILEVVIGYVMLGLLVAIISRRVIGG